jgi:hypothetical protein
LGFACGRAKLICEAAGGFTAWSNASLQVGPSQRRPEWAPIAADSGERCSFDYPPGHFLRDLSFLGITACLDDRPFTPYPGGDSKRFANATYAC